jgi:ABC-type phosphate transport system substrate-binding protein
MIYKHFLLGLMVITSVLPSAVAAGVVVVVNPGNSISEISVKDAQRIYLGKSSKFADGSDAEFVDQNVDQPARASFYKNVVGKSESQAKSYWSKRLFTGKGSPPAEVGGDAEVKAQVSANVNAIGYIDSGSLDSSVKQVLVID